jgi:hypothetical protein
MANEIVGLKIQVDSGEATKSVGSLKAQLREAQADVTKLSEKFGATSKEAVEAAKRAADLRDRIGDARALTDAFNPDAKFRAFTATLSGVAGGFAAVQGALGLVGVESDKVEKTLLKVQSAMAISQGLQTLGESIDSFKQLGAVIQATTVFQKAYNIATIAAGAIQKAFGVAVTGTSLAFRALRGAILATGIGALVIGIGVLVDKIIDWTNRTSEAEKAQNKLAASTKKMNGEIDNQISVLTALGGKEEEIYKLRLQRNENELNVLRNKLKTTGKLNEEEMAEFRKLKTDKEVLDIQEANRIKKEQENRVKVNLDANKKILEDRKANKIEIENADKELAQKSLQISDELFLNEIKNEKEREEVRIATQYERDKKEIEDSKATQEHKNAALLLLKQKYFADLKALEDAEKEKQIIASQDELTNIINGFVAEEELNLFYLERDKKLKEQYRQADLEATVDLQNKKFDAVNAGLNLLESLSGRNEAIGNIFFAIQKAIEIGRIVTSTSAAIAKVTADTASIPTFIPPGIPNPAFPIAVATGAKKIAGLKIGAAASIANIIASSISKFKSGGSVAGGGSDLGQASVSAPISPSQSLINTRTLLNADAIGRLGSATNRAYVLESDVTNSQERIRRINRAARLG